MSEIERSTYWERSSKYVEQDEKEQCPHSPRRLGERVELKNVLVARLSDELADDRVPQRVGGLLVKHHATRIAVVALVLGAATHAEQGAARVTRASGLERIGPLASLVKDKAEAVVSELEHGLVR